MACKYLFEMHESDIEYWNMKKHGVKSAHQLETLSFAACVAKGEDSCPKKRIKGKITPHCWRINR